MKSKQSFLFLCSLLLTSLIYAQSSTMKGRISVFDSKNEDGDIEYIEDALISTPYSKSVKSDYKGRFLLKMNGHQSGDPLQLVIRKEGYELVNQMDVENAEPNNQYTVRIFLAPKGKMTEIRNEMLRNATAYVSNLKEELLDSFAFDRAENPTANASIEKRSGQKVYNALEAEEVLLKMSNHIDEQLPDYMFSLAAINPDYASKMFKSAYAYYKDGKIDKAIKTIDENKLTKAISHIKKVLEDANNDPSKEYKLITLRMKTLNQIRDSYILKIIALQQSFQFVEANKALERLATISKIIPSVSDSKFIEKLRIPDLSTMSVENNDMVLGDKKMVKEEEINYESDKKVFNEKRNAIAAEKNITSLTQLGEKDNSIGEGKIFSEENPKSLEDAKVDDFENTLFIPEGISEKLVSILNREKNGGTSHSSKQPIMVSRGAVSPSPSPTPPPVRNNVQRAPVVISQPQVAVIDRSTYISVEDIVTMKAEVKTSKKSVKKARRYSSQSITKRTSLRKSPTASSRVLKRLAVGTKVQVIEQVDKYWCRVILNGREGFVKSFLLK